MFGTAVAGPAERGVGSWHHFQISTVSYCNCLNLAPLSLVETYAKTPRISSILFFLAAATASLSRARRAFSFSRYAEWKGVGVGGW